MLDDVACFLNRFVRLSEPQAAIVTLWIVHTHAIRLATTTPYLAITSAEKQSGKTRLLEVLELLVNKPWLTGHATAASLIRKIDKDRPTLLLDESDAAFQGDKQYAEALRGVLNTGHRRGGQASCCIGQGANITVKDFQTFCPKAIAGIGKLPDTVADRSIPIRLKRKGPGEPVQRFRRRLVKPQADTLRERVSMWAAQIKEAPEPPLPDALSDRQQDGAEPLLVVADTVGGDWSHQGRQSLIEIFGGRSAEDQSHGVRLLSDVRDIFEVCGVESIATKELIEKLVEIETSPWSEWNHGKAITPVSLSRLLKRFDIAPRGIRLGDVTPKGYSRASFEDTFARYLPSRELEPDVETQHPPQSNIRAEATDFSEPPQKAPVADVESEESACIHAGCGGCCGSKPGSSTRGRKTSNSWSWMDGGNHLIPAAILVDEVAYLGGSLVLLLDDGGTSLRLALPAAAQWLSLEIRRHKSEIIAELSRRYLQGAIR